MRRALLLAVAGLLAVCAAAQAAPGDPPIVPTAPADGATVPANADGIEVAFGCPAYYEFPEPGRPPNGNYENYRVRFSAAPALGPDGRLAAKLTEDAGATPVEPARTSCTAQLDTYDDATSPEIVGGRVYWQAYRECRACPGFFESGPVLSFTVRPAIGSRLTVPRRVYAGYPAAFTVTPSGAPQDADSLLQRRIRGSWRTIARGDRRRDDLVATLPAGRQRVRGVVQLGDRTFAGAPRTVRVRRGGARATGRADDGRYASTDPDDQIRFRVTGGGRLVRGFRARLVVFCVGATIPDNRAQIAFAGFERARIAPDGRFIGVLQVENARTEVHGRIRDGRFTGDVDTAFSTCSGDKSYKARRR